MENKNYLSKQIITYLGNKRKLLLILEREVKKILKKLGKKKIISLDLFSGSGIVARMLKQYSSLLYTNDLEIYSKLLNDVFLMNKKDFNQEKYNEYSLQISERLKMGLFSGIITKNYAPKDDKNIKLGERAFFTNQNAKIIDTIRDEIEKINEEKYKKIFLASLIQKASVHSNTGGMFKGFYKDKFTGIGKFGGSDENALSRIKSTIKLEKPIFSNFNCEFINYQMDANELVKKINYVDLTYIDPPYNQHPYGANYFMLNLIIKNVLKDNISKISGIVNDWNRSKYNQKREVEAVFEELIKNIQSSYIIISYNSEGFLSYKKIVEILGKHGEIKKIKKIKYITYRAGRNISSRREKNNKLKEYIFILKKRLNENGKFKTT